MWHMYVQCYNVLRALGKFIEVHFKIYDMFKIVLIILALIGLVGTTTTTTTKAFANGYMGGPAMGPADSGSSSGGSSSQGPSDTTTSPGGSDMSSWGPSDTTTSPGERLSSSAVSGWGHYQEGASDEDTPGWYITHGWHHHNAEGGLPGYWHHGDHPYFTNGAGGWMDAHGGLWHHQSSYASWVLWRDTGGYKKHPMESHMQPLMPSP